nr:Transcription initiation factor TFIIIB Brf1 subunit [Volvox reticuliferus]BCL66274.1 Transcription initiation factor TFIIIB Brf1 subunit [Volvox reticuliferus]
MVWCSQCQAEVEVEADEAKGFSCCVQCGRVVEDTAFSSDVMFAKGSDGAGELVGQMVGANGDAHGIGRYSGGRLWASGGGHEAAVSRGRQEVVALVEALRISPSSEAIEAAHRLYRLALQRGFTKGRRVNQVAAVCLYIFCRLERRPYMLIDFSDHLSVNVYELGAVFLNMLRLLRLDEHATFTKPIDPSLFMNRFVDRLRLPTQELRTKIGNTATRLVQSMKRDWMLTGRRPNGICGAALFLAAHIYGVEKTKMDIISIVHVGWGTVERRVMELAETGGADLTLKEIEERDKASELERERMLLEYERAASERAAREGADSGLPQLPWLPGGDGSAEGPEEADGGSAVVPRGEMDSGALSRVCEHVRTGGLLVAHGMCRQCLEEYLQVTMAVQEGAQNPPAFVRNLRRDVRKRVRAQLESERPMLLLEGAGPAGEEEDIHQARHRENEAAAEEGATPDAPTDGHTLGPTELAAGTSRKAAGGKAGGARISAAEEADFDEALRSSDLQPLAKALGGVVAAVATAPLLQRSRPDAQDADAEGEQRNVVPRLEGGMGPGASAQRVAASGGPARGAQPGAAASQDAPNVQALKALALDACEGAPPPAVPADAGGAAASADDAELVAVPAHPRAMEVASPGSAGREEEVLSSDNLSDVDEDEITGYLATREEASMREQLWVEMNKDWIEKQQAKKAAEAEATQAGAERPKRKYTRKKAELPAAEDAAGATRNLLASKKLSNKINYGALADLFDSPAAPGGAGDTLGNTGTPTGAAVLGSFQDDAGAPAADGFEDFGGAATQPERSAGRGGGRAGLDEDKYTAALEEDQSRLGGLGGGGFLGSLTFMRGAGEVKGSGGRARPQGLNLKPRGR